MVRYKGRAKKCASHTTKMSIHQFQIQKRINKEREQEKHKQVENRLEQARKPESMMTKDQQLDIKEIIMNEQLIINATFFQSKT